MTIDWITVAAQVLNFILLIWLLKRFLYRPVLRAVEARQVGIERAMAEAEQARQDAEREAKRYGRMSREIEESRTMRLKEVEQQGDELRHALAQKARTEVHRLREGWLKGLADEQAAVELDIKEHLARAFVDFSRRAIADLAGSELEEHIVARFIRELQRLDDTEVRSIRKALDAGTDEVHVRTAFAITPALRKQLVAAIEDAFGTGHVVSFERSRAIVCGIELRAAGKLLRWSVESMLEAVGSDIADALGRARSGELQGLGDAP